MEEFVPASLRPAPEPGAHRGGTLLHEARIHERSGQMAEAIVAYTAAIEAASMSGASAVLAEALRRLGIVRHLRNESAVARELCQRSHAVAVQMGDNVLAAEALNALAGFHLESGEVEAAREAFHQALELAGQEAELLGRIQQNLGILANVQGDWTEAREHYLHSLNAFTIAGNEAGCAIAYHNLGMISSDRKLWDDAETYFNRSLELARLNGDIHLEGLCLLNHSEVHLAHQRYVEALSSAEGALRIFDQLGTRLDKADAYRMLGMIYRETGRPVLAEARLRAAMKLAVETASVLSEAEAARELARLYQDMGRNQDALTLLNSAHRLFTKLDARHDLVDVQAKRENFEGTYLAVVRGWGQSIESADTYTFGHCERVAEYAVMVARALQFDEQGLTTIRLGAYLHDVGKMRVPHEILNKPGALTKEEFETIKMHPIWGIELLASVEFPWDIKPMIRWHHEKYDGSGYPDRLRGEEIPLGAQIICIVDVYDALTSTRSYRPAMTKEEAIAQMESCRHWWKPDVYDAFMRTVAQAQ